MVVLLFFKAYDGSLSNDRQLDVLCGVRTKNMLSVSNVMYIQFFMKTAGENMGFLITYSQGMYTFILNYLSIHNIIERKC